MSKLLGTLKRLPMLVVFDLDYTLWPLWIDTHVTGPIFIANSSVPYEIFDKYGTKIKLYPEVPTVLNLVKGLPGVKLALASRTEEPDWAHNALSKMPFPLSEGEAQNTIASTEKSENYTSLNDIFDYKEIYPTSKVKHFRALHEKTGIPYSEMIFFDDELRNRNVESELGVMFIHVPDGITMSEFLDGMRNFDTRRGGVKDEV